jgi:GDSL-like Lipase/Acylhydrolase
MHHLFNLMKTNLHTMTANFEGFVEPLISCCGHGGKYNYDVNYGCGATMRVNNTDILVGKSCPEPLKKVCWDGIHYTEAANRFIFEQIADGKFSDPPVPLKLACLHNV